MPELNPEFAKVQKELETLLKELTNQLTRAGLTKVQLAQIAAEVDFFQELKSFGFEDLVNKYFNGYDKIITQRINEAAAQGVKGLANVDIDSLLQIKELETQHLLKRAEAFSLQYKRELFTSLIRGDSIPETISRLQGINLTDAQLGTVLNTQYSEFSRTATKAIYKAKPEQKFRYMGRAGAVGEAAIIPTSSDECKWLIRNQRPEGYTVKEIEAGIETPYNYPELESLGELAGTVKKIYWQGRLPNWNCGHEFSAISGEVKKEGKTFAEAKKLGIVTDKELDAIKNDLLKRPELADEYEKVIQNRIDVYKDNLNAPDFNRPKQYYGEPLKDAFKNIDLTKEEERAIANYTSEGYRDMNNHLRFGKEVNESVLFDIKNLESALNKLPNYNGDVFRGFGLPRIESEKLKVGDIFTDNGFFSTTSVPDVTRNFTGGEIPIEVRILSNNGKYMGEYTSQIGGDNIAGELEVLYNRNSSFRIRSIIREGQKGFENRDKMELEEL